MGLALAIEQIQTGETALKSIEPASIDPAPKRRRTFLRAFRGWFWRKMPKGLYARTLLIIIIPMVLLQSVLAFVFLERHWQTVTKRLSKAVVGDIAAIIEVIEKFPQESDYERVTTLANERLDLNISVLPPDPFPPAAAKPFFSILDDALQAEITKQVSRPFWIDTVGDSDLLEIRIRLTEPENVLRVFVKRSRAYASNSHIFMVWMIGTSLLLLLIAITLLRNQIKPIVDLADAVDRFGKGREMSADFRIRGATEVRNAGLAFMQMRERIERQIEQRTTMLTGVSHDLRTILTRFKLQLALVGQTREIEDLQQDVDEMQQMLQGYIDFARGEGGEEIGSIKLKALLDRFVSQAESGNQTLAVECEEELLLKGRPNAIGRLFSNLVSNGLRYAQNIQIFVSKSAGWVTVVLDDDGPGVPEDKREEVFKPFYRLDEARNLNESGTGLGLAIARDIARNHGGDINLHENEHGGLRAIVRLPV